MNDIWKTISRLKTKKGLVGEVVNRRDENRFGKERDFHFKRYSQSHPC